MRLALFEPEIPQNTGTLLRLGACLEVPLDLVEPCGFVLNDRRMKRAGMDYLARAAMTRHENWAAFYEDADRRKQRLVLIDPRSSTSYCSFSFTPCDTLVLGKESTGFSETVYQDVPLRVSIPMRAEARSLNVAIAGALVLGEALRQTHTFPNISPQDPAPVLS